MATRARRAGKTPAKKARKAATKKTAKKAAKKTAKKAVKKVAKKVVARKVAKKAVRGARSRPGPTMSTRRAACSFRRWVRRPSSRMNRRGRATDPALRHASMKRTESGPR